MAEGEVWGKPLGADLRHFWGDWGEGGEQKAEKGVGVAYTDTIK